MGQSDEASPRDEVAQKAISQVSSPPPPPAFLGAPIPIYVVVLYRRVVLPGGRNYWIICFLCTRKAM